MSFTQGNVGVEQPPVVRLFEKALAGHEAADLRHIEFEMSCPCCKSVVQIIHVPFVQNTSMLDTESVPERECQCGWLLPPIVVRKML